LQNTYLHENTLFRLILFCFTVIWFRPLSQSHQIHQNLHHVKSYFKSRCPIGRASLNNSFHELFLFLFPTRNENRSLWSPCPWYFVPCYIFFDSFVIPHAAYFNCPTSTTFSHFSTESLYTNKTNSFLQLVRHNSEHHIPGDWSVLFSE